MRDSMAHAGLVFGIVGILLVGPFGALAVPLSGAAGQTAETATDASAERPPTAPGGTFEIDDSLADANGTVEVIVRFAEVPEPALADADDGVAALESHANATQDPLLSSVADEPGVTAVTDFWVTNAVVLEVDLDRVDLESFERFENVTEIHPNIAVSAPDPPSVEPSQAGDDDGASTDSGTAGYATTPGLASTNVPAVWEEYGTRGEGVRVAVLDTGIDVDHPDLELYTEDPSDPTYPGGWAEFDGTGARVEGSVPHDDGAHGTHVSGTVAGGAESGAHIGVAPDVELLHGQVISESDGGTFARLVAGMEWAVANDADVIGMSLGAAGSHDAFVDPVRNARAEGTIVVAAVGNEGAGTSSSPANVRDAVAVGAVDDDGRVPSFSGGRELNGANWTAPPDDWPDSYTVPDVVAPGWFVTSAVPGGGYEAYPGTSMAAPHVAGTVALLLALDPGLSPAEVDTALTETAWKPAGEATGPDPRYGYGIVDAKAAADAVEPPVMELWIPSPSESTPSVAASVAVVLVAALGISLALGVARRRARD